jgi:hypothetical protein
MPPGATIAIVLSFATGGALAFALARYTNAWVLGLWSILLVAAMILGATMMLATGHMAGVRQLMALMFLWAPAVGGAGLGTVTGRLART